jgi:putative DNA primase/helicase
VLTSINVTASEHDRTPPGDDPAASPNSANPDSHVWPDTMVPIPQWVTWRLEPNPDRPEKPNKAPYDPKTGRHGSSTNNRTWGSFEQATQAVKTYQHKGIGFVFAANDGMVFIDLDGCRNPVTGELDALAQWALHTLDTYTEVSQSGRGIHLIAKGELAPGVNHRLEPLAEVYAEKRFVAMTGQHVPGTPTDVMVRPEAVKHVHSMLGSMARIEKDIRGGAFGPTRKRLWEGDRSDFDNDDSAADFSMLTFLAYSFNDPEVIEVIMRRTKLVRQKWDDARGETTWLGYQIQAAMAKVADARKSAIPDALDRRTDLGLARIFVQQHGDKIRYVYAWSKWLVWDGRQWVQDDSGAVARLLINTVETLFAAIIDESDPLKRQEALRWAAKCESATSIQNALYLASKLPGVPIDHKDLDPDPWLFNVGNGVLDLKTGALLAHDPAYLITKMAGTSWDAEAECPIWRTFLETVLPDLETRLFLQRAAGYSMTGLTWEQCLFFLFGSGQNGKTTALEVLMKLFGEYAGKTRAETFMEKRGQSVPNDVAALVGLRLVTTSEIGQDQKLNEAIVKDVTGADTMTARFMRQEFFSFVPVLKAWMYGNHKPIINGTDDGIWRRIRLVPFAVRIPDERKDPELPSKLAAELPGILHWAMEGCSAWREDGLSIPEQVKEATAEYRDQMDTLGEFLAARCVTGSNLSVTTAKLYNTYVGWSNRRNEKPISQKALGLRLSERGFTKGKVGQDRGWTGLRLKMAVELRTDGVMDSDSDWDDDGGSMEGGTFDTMLREPKSRFA